jgi:hypothetical protein
VRRFNIPIKIVFNDQANFTNSSSSTNALQFPAQEIMASKQVTTILIGITAVA